jgi:pimeloyl-ACP methyl ester carboxylesterase
METLRNILLLVAALLSVEALAQDYAREKRWADEVLAGLVVGDAVFLKAASGKDFLAIHAAGKPDKPALVIVHGIGVHPDHGVIGVLRSNLAEAGYTTLAIQMPVLDKDKRAGDYYPLLFPDAIDRIGVAAAWLTGRGHRHLVLVSHSLGSWMANVYLDRTQNAPFRAWVCMGLTGGFQSRMLGIDWPMLGVQLPILDVYGENDLAPSVEAASRRARSIAGNPGSRQARIPGADHFYSGTEKELTATIANFVEELK